MCVRQLEIRAVLIAFGAAWATTIGALLAVVVVVALLAHGADVKIATDTVWDLPAMQPGLTAIAPVSGSIGDAVCARLAPHTPFRHAFLLGITLTLVGPWWTELSQFHSSNGPTLARLAYCLLAPDFGDGNRTYRN